MRHQTWSSFVWRPFSSLITYTKVESVCLNRDVKLHRLCIFYFYAWWKWLRLWSQEICLNSRNVLMQEFWMCFTQLSYQHLAAGYCCDVGLRLWTCLCCCGFYQFWEPDTFRILEENEMSRTILRLIFFGFRPSYLDADKVAKSADWSGTPRMLWFLSALYPTAVITQESKWRPQPKLSLFLGNEVWPHFNLGDYCMCVTAKKNTDSKENILHRIIWIHVS